MFPAQCAVDIRPQRPCALTRASQRALGAAHAVVVAPDSPVDRCPAQFALAGCRRETAVFRFDVASRRVESQAVVVCRRQGKGLAGGIEEGEGSDRHAKLIPRFSRTCRAHFTSA